MTRKEKFIRFMIVAPLVIVVTLAIMFYVTFLRYPYNDMRFSRDVWLVSADIEHDNPRLKMAEDVRDRIIKPGMSRAEVVNLLGKPDSTWDVERIYPGVHERLNYYLGNSGGAFAIDDDELSVYLDKSGHVIRVEFHET